MADLEFFDMQPMAQQPYPQRPMTQPQQQYQQRPAAQPYQPQPAAQPYQAPAGAESAVGWLVCGWSCDLHDHVQVRGERSHGSDPGLLHD